MQQQPTTGEQLAQTRIALRVIELEKIEKSLDEIASMPTVKMPSLQPQKTRELPLSELLNVQEDIISVQLPAYKPSRPTRPVLPMDEQGRAYIKLYDPQSNFKLLELVEDAVTHYRHAENRCPPSVQLGKSRFHARRLDAYYTQDLVRIPYELCSEDVDVMVRSA